MGHRAFSGTLVVCQDRCVMGGLAEGHNMERVEWRVDLATKSGPEFQKRKF